MNILHLRYVVEIEKTKSISKAAENLYMNQPNLSRAVKELEESLGIMIFRRTSKGITITPDGEVFLSHAKGILSQIDEVESIYHEKERVKQKIAVAVPRATYISAAFADFVKQLDEKEPIDIYYKETNAMQAIENLIQGEYQLAVIRYQSGFDRNFKKLLKEKNLESELLSRFTIRALMSEKNPCTLIDEVCTKDLLQQIEIAHPDPYVPELSFMDVKKAEFSEHINKRIFVFERASQMDLLSEMDHTYMWVSPIPQRIKEQYHLVEKQVIDHQKEYMDVLIYRREHKRKEIESEFIAYIKKYANVLE